MHLCRRSAFIGLTALAGVAGGEIIMAAAPSPADLVAPAAVEAVTVSPGGERLAFVVSRFADAPQAGDERETALFVIDSAGTGEPQRITAWGREPRAPRWHPQGDTLAFVMNHADGDAQLHVRKRDDRPQALTQADGGLDVDDLAWSPDGERVAFTGHGPDQRTREVDRNPVVDCGSDPVSRLWTVAGSGGEPRAVTGKGVDVDAFAWSPDSARLALLITAGLDGQAAASPIVPATLVTIAADGGERKQLSQRASGFGSRDRTLDWSPDGESILFAHRPGMVPRSAPAVVPADGGEVRPLLPDYPGHIMRARWRGDTGDVIAQAFRGVESRLLHVDVERGGVEELTRFNHRYPTFAASADGDTIVYVGHESDAAANVWRYRADGADRRLTDLSPDLRELELGNVRRVEWHNEAAGLRLEGVLVTPPAGAAEPPYPLFVQPHGGPHHHWSLGWQDNWSQWLAPQGYAVFLPNPRGSTGRSWAFAETIRYRLGDPDGDDVLAGVDALVARGIADPERLYIGGGSYAGFLTNWLVTQTDRFRAAIVWAGISDFVSFAGTAGLGEAWSEAFFPGSVQHRMAAYEDRSPLRYLHRASTPMLIMHGEDDPKIPPGQARQLHHGLQALDVDSELVIYPDAGHGLSAYGDRIDALERVRDWVERH